jgi:regulator of protease activity HflC (stomatin/prohibitin superfamily)
MYFILGAAILLILVIFLSGLRVVRPTSRGLVERLGKYRRFARTGLNWITPVIDRLYRITITEVMVDDIFGPAQPGGRLEKERGG